MNNPVKVRTIRLNQFARELLDLVDASEFCLDIRDFSSHRSGDSTDDRVPVCLGVGQWPLLDDWPSSFLVQSKGAQDRFTPRPRSGVEVVARHADAAFQNVDLWKAGPFDHEDLQATLARLRFVVEDVSPDSVFAAFFLLALLRGVPRDELPDVWIDAVARWEYSSQAPSSRGWCSLECSLTQHLDLRTNHAISEAWRLALQFAAAAIHENEDPNRLSEDFLRRWGAAAVSRADSELQEYQLALENARKVQALLPIAGEGVTRHRLVDALILYQHEPIGAVKEYARRDRENSPLGRGFELLVYFNPSEAPLGRGYEATISVTNESLLDLSEVWRELEQCETLAWERSGTRRPNDNPRRIALPDGPSNQWNEPWFPKLAHERGFERVVLIGAPKLVSNDPQVLGRKLTFADIEDAIWAKASPSSRFIVIDRANDGREGPICDSRPDESWRSLIPTEFSTETRKLVQQPVDQLPTLLLSEYSRNSPENPSRLLPSETLRAEIVTKLARPLEAIRLRSIETKSDYEIVDLLGGLALVSDNGAWIFDDWTDPQIPWERFRAEFANNVARLTVVCDLEGELDSLQNRFREHVERPRWRDSRRATALMVGIARMRSRFAGELAASEKPPSTSELARFRSAIESKWGLSQRIEGLRKRLLAFEEGLQTVESVRTRAGLDFITLIGVPLAAGSVTAEPVQRIIDQAEVVLEARAMLERCVNHAEAAVDATATALQSITQHPGGVCVGFDRLQLEHLASESPNLVGELLVRWAGPWADFTAVGLVFLMTFALLAVGRTLLRRRAARLEIDRS